MKRVLTPRELAEAIGVSESSLKRWVDEGRISATRTAGGHRRIPLTEAVHFIRRTQSPLLRPECLGMPEIQEAGGGESAETGGHQGQQLLDDLLAGRARAVRGRIMQMYLAGTSASAIVDGPLRFAMTRIGQLWHETERGIFIEHRATDIVVSAINQWRSLLDVASDAPVAVGGAPVGDPYILPPLAASTVLNAEGLEAINLGAHTPAESLLQAAAEHGASIVWLSVSHVADRNDVRAEIGLLARGCRERGSSLMVGGRDVIELGLDLDTDVHIGRTMAELVAFAKGILAAQRQSAATDYA